MNKISIDTCCDPKTGEKITPARIAEISSACLQIESRLGKLAGAIEAFRVTFVKFEGSKKAGPKITIHFTEFAGNKGSHTSDYRFMGSPEFDKSFNPSADEIVEHFCKDGLLARLIEEHLSRSKAQLLVQRSDINWLLGLTH